MDVSFPHRPTILLIGSWHRPEFREAIDLLRARTELAAVTTIDDAANLLGGDLASAAAPIWPDAFVLAQGHPGQFSTAEVARLKRMAPLARVLGLLGSWCEGETRTGKPWPAVDRSFWYQWAPRFRVELDRMVRGRCPRWGLPETASATEQTLWAADDPLPQRSGVVVVWGRCAETADAVGDICRAAGFTPRLVAPGWVGGGGLQGRGRQGLDRTVVAIWEGTQCEPDEAEQLARFSRALGGVPVVALLDFPRPDGCERAAVAGAAGVVGKPFQLRDLLSRLDESIGWRGFGPAEPDLPPAP